MERSRRSIHDLLFQRALEYALSPVGFDEASGRDQTVPINVYETDEDVVIVAPMPGVEAENIDIEVLGSTVRLRAGLRGPGQEERRYLLHEWTYGPYERTVTLPVDVDGEHANASHGNGVLVLSLPKARKHRAVRVPLRQMTANEAEHQGHAGHHTTREGLGAATDDDNR